MPSPSNSSSPLPSSPLSSLNSDDFEGFQFEKTHNHEETQDIKFGQPDDPFDERALSQVLPIIPGDEEAQGVAPQEPSEHTDLPSDISYNFTTKAGILGGEDGRLVVGLAPATVISLDDLNLEDLPGVPSTFEDIRPIESLNGDGLDENQKFSIYLEDVNPIEPQHKANDILLYHSGSQMVDSIFDLAPLGPATDPYSWIIADSGAVLKTVEPPVERARYNIEGEMAVEFAIKSFATRPDAYILLSTCVKCLVRSRYQNIITEQEFASLMYRCIDGDPRVWDPIKRAFIPKDFSIIRSAKDTINSAIRSLHSRLKRNLSVRSTKTLVKLIEAVLRKGHANCFLVHRETGHLVDMKLKQSDNLDISRDFMRRYGGIWPFWWTSPRRCDIYGVGAPLRFKDVFENAQYLGRKEKKLGEEKRSRPKKKRILRRKRWEFPVEECRQYLTKV